MPREETTTRTLYKFSELSEESQDKAIEKLWDLNVDCGWRESIYDDAERAGFKITEFDIDCGNMIRGKLTVSVLDSIKAIMADHGEQCETYKTALSFKARAELIEAQDNIDDDDEALDPNNDLTMDDIADEYTRAMLKEYLSMLKQEYEYQTSREQIIESIEANDYEFDENGNLA